VRTRESRGLDGFELVSGEGERKGAEGLTGNPHFEELDLAAVYVGLHTKVSHDGFMLYGGDVPRRRL
jgi:hypothetical protein